MHQREGTRKTTISVISIEKKTKAKVFHMYAHHLLYSPTRTWTGLPKCFAASENICSTSASFRTSAFAENVGFSSVDAELDGGCEL